MPCGRVPATLDHADLVALVARAYAAAGPQGVVTHLPLDAAGDDAAATGAHALRAHFVEDALPRRVVACVVLRGEWLPHAAASGGSPGGYA